MAWAWVIIGSALGGMTRYGISGAVARRIGETFPWGTLAVNVSGSFVIGVVAALVMPGHAPAGERMAGVFVMKGLWGGHIFLLSFRLPTVNTAPGARWTRPLAPFHHLGCGGPRAGV